MDMRTTMVTTALLAAWLAGPAAAMAQTNDQVRAARARLANEPTVAETVREALQYFRVDPEAFDNLRSAANTRSLLPLIAAGFAYTDDRFSRFETETFSPLEFDENTNRRAYSATVGGVWDFREAVFNPAEVQVYGLIGVQRDIMLEVTRTYYLRRQLMLRMMLRPPEDALAMAALELRIEEFTAILDVLTDGWFSEEARDRASGRNRNGG